MDDTDSDEEFSYLDKVEVFELLGDALTEGCLEHQMLTQLGC